MLIAIAALALLALAFGSLLGYSSIRFRVEGDPIVEKIEALLPQTQCGQCSFPGCHAYAEALANDQAEINACPPGGETTMIALSDLLGKDPLPMEGGAAEEKPKAVAVIREDECIGCTLCIQACPVDAILGSAKSMHTVISSECTGCELCLPPCPVECIDMKPLEVNTSNWKWPYPGDSANNRSIAASSVG
ncbi:electron transport complex subunit RsxB [Sedimenticola selenatireducens]|jgi:electron transport complex protein RnfB|uniref:Ion-translocating oxidoreductase complex subunit B n=1 Tax=Sedimenticola selenatireducens TaxID=191960 RepID=A0A558E191_9GAMM|nr:electron transport complex subunit RsxB [Sedimenticola selenatireducens]TVO75227.1 electron transport complex subunit RsxB [Sedimenticola selenatireducens]TVT66919.1 MAG: electron transport complex subunit RsxB [Sedimenticola selenatireducens]